MTPVKMIKRGGWGAARPWMGVGRRNAPPPEWMECIELAARAGLRLRVGDLDLAAQLVRDALLLGDAAVDPWGGGWRNRRLTSRIAKDLRQHALSAHRLALVDAQSSPRRGGIETAACTVRIYALGSFNLSLRGIPFLGGAKPSRRPMDLLKALIANGGGVMAASKLADMLWPDADGDDARNSLQVAVYRLRRLLRCENAVVVQDGRISVDRELAWVDAWAFENEAARVLQGEEDPRLVLARAAGALELYRGHLFAHEPDQPWMLSYRERLRMTWGRVVRQTGAMQETSGRWERAAELYQKALELDPLLEDLYRRLMLCQQRTGERSAALHTYERCRQQLVRVLGVSPSLETERLYRALRSAA